MTDPRSITEEQREWAEKNQARIRRARETRMMKVDALPKALRELVHEYGLNIVYAMLDNGICAPNIIKHLVETVLDEFSPTRGSSSVQGIRTIPELRHSEPQP